MSGSENSSFFRHAFVTKIVTISLLADLINITKCEIVGHLSQSLGFDSQGIRSFSICATQALSIISPYQTSSFIIITN